MGRPPLTDLGQQRHVGALGSIVIAVELNHALARLVPVHDRHRQVKHYELDVLRRDILLTTCIVDLLLESFSLEFSYRIEKVLHFLYRRKAISCKCHATYLKLRVDNSGDELQLEYLIVDDECLGERDLPVL